MTTTYPPKLKKGDLIGIISPSSPIADPSRIEKGVRYLESLGYRVLVGENVGKTNGYLAGTDEQRVADLHAMFSDLRVKAIICVRGGYGTPRLLSLFNYKLASRNPKILVGFSDVTALQLALWKKCRLITFHGPMAGVEMANHVDHFTEELFWRVLTSSKRIGAISLPSEPAPEPLVPGKAIGRLLGGNLSLVASLMGTKYQPDFTNSILFLEEIAEEPYRIDRMLTQLRNGSVFNKASGMLLGQFTDCTPLDETKPSLSTSQVLDEAALKFGKPVLANLPFGHVPKKLTLPSGLKVKMNATTNTLHFLEAAVR